ncbi:E3 ubiquitin-protein ligase RNF31-like, partial [Mustelus asterias]
MYFASLWLHGGAGRWNVLPGRTCRNRITVTVEVAMLQMELDKLQKGTHPHPELFSRFLPPDVGPPLALGGQQEETLEPCPPASNPAAEEPSQSAVLAAPLDKCCAVCSKEDLAVRCHTCGWLLCRDCDTLYHRHPSRGGHQRAPLRPGELGSLPSEGAVGHSPGTKGSSSWPTPLGTLASPLPQEERPERLARPGLGRRSQSADQPSTRPAAARPERRPSELASALSLPRAAWTCASCGLVNEARAVLCGACERPRASPAPLLVAGGDARPGGPVLREGWSCQACTFQNDPSAVLCSACERPRLAGKPSFVPANLSDSILEQTLQPIPGMANQVTSPNSPPL